MEVSEDGMPFQATGVDTHSPGVCFPAFTSHSYTCCAGIFKVVHHHTNGQQQSHNLLFHLLPAIFRIAGSKEKGARLDAVESGFRTEKHKHRDPYRSA